MRDKTSENKEHRIFYFRDRHTSPLNLVNLIYRWIRLAGRWGGLILFFDI